VDALAGHGHQQPLRTQARPLAVRTAVLHHYLFQVLLHPGVRHLFLPVPAVVSLDPVRDPVEPDFFAHAPVARLRAFRQQLQELLALRAVEEDIDDLLRQLLERRLQAEAEVLRQAVHHPPVAGLLVVPERLRHKRPVQNAATLVRHQQVGMHLQVGAQPHAGSAGALRLVEHEVDRLQVHHHQIVLGTAEALVEPLCDRSAAR
jgi:hypothetical protein